MENWLEKPGKQLGADVMAAQVRNSGIVTGGHQEWEVKLNESADGIVCGVWVHDKSQGYKFCM